MHIKKIEFKWFYFILFNLFRLKSIKTDFVLTTLATRCQTSDNNWRKRRIRNQCRFWSRVATYLIDPSKQSQHDSAWVGTRNAKAGPNISMTLGGTGQRTIGWRRHEWALKLKLKHATIDHTRLWDSKCHQMQVIPLARNPREKRRKKRTPKKHKKKRKNMSPFCNLYPITAMQFMFGKRFPEIML